MARPRVKINWEEFDKLCAIHCTLIEIADWFDCSEDIIQRAVKRKHEVGFAVYYKKKSSRGKISLRRTQFKLAEKNVSMSIWLGKQYLGQSDIPQLDKEELPDGFEITDFSSISSPK